jgi:signal transduction histidine kinase
MRGLRGRFVAALILTSTLSLAIAGAALLPPLESRLEREQLRHLVVATAALPRAMAGLRPADLAHESPRLEQLARELGRRIGARVRLFDGRGRPLGRERDDLDAALPVIRRALATRRPASAARPVGQTLGFQVAVPAVVAGAPVAVVAQRASADAPLAAQVVRRAFLLAGLIGLAISALVGFWITGRLLRRLQRLRRMALTVAEEGPEAQVPVESARDEVGDLGRALATMQTNLRRQEEARRAFVSTASHELRTPLALLQLTLELLDDRLDREGLDRRDVKREVGRARAQSERLGRLAASLLDLSRIDAGLVLRSEPVDMIEVCRAVVAEFAPRMAAGGSLRLDAPDRECWARADPTAVARILAILLDNAVRYAPATGAVTVAVRDSGPVATISVADEGPGVLLEDRARIFRRFERGSSRGGEGFGLGLAIGSDLAQRMHARLVLADSDAGATFELVLPSASVVADHAGLARREPPRGDADQHERDDVERSERRRIAERVAEDDEAAGYRDEVGGRRHQGDHGDRTARLQATLEREEGAAGRAERHGGPR